MNKPANDNLPRQKNSPRHEIQGRNHRPTLHSARPRLSGICEPLLAQNWCAASPKSVRGAGRPARSGIPRDIHEDARDVARPKTKAFLKSRDRGSGSRCALRT